MMAEFTAAFATGFGLTLGVLVALVIWAILGMVISK